ncbi:MerR family DNA-binding protein [Streptomyces sp. NPDC020096]
MIKAVTWADDLSAPAMGITTSVEAVGWTVAEFARRAETTTDTVWYYERARLLPPAPRGRSGYRRFGEAALDRLRFIQGAQRLGLKLREIRGLLAVRDTGVCPCEPTEDLLQRHLAERDAEMARLAALRVELVGMLGQIPGPNCPDPTPGTWCPPVTADGRGR